MTSDRVDKYYPVICSAVIAFAYLGLFAAYPKFALQKGFRDIFIATITVNAISVGFLATAKATLLSIHSSKVVRWMKDSGTYETTIIYFMDAVNISIVCAIWSMVVLLIDFNDPVKYILFCIDVWLFLVAYSLMTMYRVIRVFSKILRKV